MISDYNKNNGFTLVELIVAVLCSTFVCASVTLILKLAFSNYRDIRLESELQIEAQTLENKLVTILKGADSYAYDGNILSIKSNKIVDNKIVTKFYYIIIDDKKAYLVTSNVKLDNPTYTDSDYLANFVQSITITPSQYSSTSSDSSNRYVELSISEYESGVAYNKNSSFRLRQGD